MISYVTLRFFTTLYVFWGRSIMNRSRWVFEICRDILRFKNRANFDLVWIFPLFINFNMNYYFAWERPLCGYTLFYWRNALLVSPGHPNILRRSCRPSTRYARCVFFIVRLPQASHRLPTKPVHFAVTASWTWLYYNQWSVYYNFFYKTMPIP